jgi:hypothetical protein
MGHHPAPIPKASPDLAARVWNSQSRPSARKVATALSQAGRHVHFTTINRWRKQGWRSGSNEHPVDTARAALDSATPILTGSAWTSVAELVKNEPEANHLRELPDLELLRVACRELAIALII